MPRSWLPFSLRLSPSGKTDVTTKYILFRKGDEVTKAFRISMAAAEEAAKGSKCGKLAAMAAETVAKQWGTGMGDEKMKKERTELKSLQSVEFF